MEKIALPFSLLAASTDVYGSGSPRRDRRWCFGQGWQEILNRSDGTAQGTFEKIDLLNGTVLSLLASEHAPELCIGIANSLIISTLSEVVGIQSICAALVKEERVLAVDSFVAFRGELRGETGFAVTLPAHVLLGNQIDMKATTIKQSLTAYGKVQSPNPVRIDVINIMADV